MENYPKSVYKTFIIFSSILLIFGTLIWLNSPLLSLSWGRWHLPRFQNIFPLIVLSLAILAIFVFQREIQLVKSQLLNKNYSILVNFLETEIQNLSEKYKFSQEKVNTLKFKIKFLSQLTDIPELSLYLMDKTLKIMDKYHTELNVQISDSFKTVKNIPIDDLKQILDLMLSPILSNLDTNKNRGDINLFINENNGQIGFNIMYDYTGDQINTEMLEWNIKKTIRKYKGNFKAEHEYEEEDKLNVLTLILDIPKENKSKRCKTA